MVCVGNEDGYTARRRLPSAGRRRSQLPIGGKNAHSALILANAVMDRAMALSREHGVGWVSMGNTNHWMRGGTYGWQAAEAGLIGIC